MQNSFLTMQIMDSETDLNEHLPNDVLMKDHPLLLWISSDSFYNVGLQISSRTVLQYDIDT